MLNTVSIGVRIAEEALAGGEVLLFLCFYSFIEGMNDMNKKTESIKNGIFVTIGSILSWIISFGVYFLIFMLFEWTRNLSGSYSFVPYVRLGYGISWLILAWLTYRSRLPEWLKATILAGSLTTFLAAVGVLLYEIPLITALVIILVVAAALWLLRIMNKKWYHYYAVKLSIGAALFY